MNYQKRIVLFLDILGFKKIIQDTDSKSVEDIERNAEKIEALYNVMAKMGGLAGVDSPKQKRKLITVTQFSDSIVISFDEEDPQKCNYVFRSILFIIIHLVNNKIICRGAMSAGKLIHNQKILFGPALVDAYETESKAAMYPRVIMDRNIYNLTRLFTDRTTNKIVIPKYFSQIINLDFDGKYYIDYFMGPLFILRERKKIIQYYENLRGIIVDGLRNTPPDLKVKYGWMRTKFNSFIEEIQTDTFISKNPTKSDILSLKQIK